MSRSGSITVDLGPAQERVIQAAKDAVAEAWDGAWLELEDAVKQLQALEDSIGGHQQ